MNELYITVIQVHAVQNAQESGSCLE